jgi:ABC-type branched-subunit amino acid transport system ATPase component
MMRGRDGAEGMLEVDRVNTFRGPAHILRDVSLVVNEGESVCLVGRNGAGKTTTIDSIMGLLPVRSGRITFQGRDITRLPAHVRALSGIGYSPELPDQPVARPGGGGPGTGDHGRPGRRARLRRVP